MNNKQTPAKKEVKKGQQVLAKLADNGKKILFIIGGFVAGSIATKAINTILKVDETTTGFKKGIAPLVITGAGITGTIFFKREDLKLLSMGVTTAGVVKGVKVLFNKDLLAGLSGLSSAKPIEFEVRSFTPELPEYTKNENQRLLGLQGQNLEAVIGVLGENLREKVEGWLSAIQQGKWGFQDRGEKTNIAAALWQMYQNQKIIDYNTWQAALEANNMTEEEAMEGIAGMQVLDEKLDVETMQGIDDAEEVSDEEML